MRMRNASTSTPKASEKAIGLTIASSVMTKLAKTLNMIRAAAVTTREAERAPPMTEGRARHKQTTIAMNGSSEAPSRSETSMLTAVLPVTATSAPVSYFSTGACPRLSPTRSSVAWSSGALVGTSWISAPPLRSSCCGRETAATPRKRPRLAAIC